MALLHSSLQHITQSSTQRAELGPVPSLASALWGNLAEVYRAAWALLTFQSDRTWKQLTGSLLETACRTFSARAPARLFPPFLSDPPPLPRPWNTSVYYHTKSLLVRRSQIFNVISALVEKKKKAMESEILIVCS